MKIRPKTEKYSIRTKIGSKCIELGCKVQCIVLG